MQNVIRLLLVCFALLGAALAVAGPRLGVIQRASVASDGMQGNDDSWNPSLSADGRFIVFQSGASNLVIGDTNSQDDIFLHDTCVGVSSGCVPSTVRVSVASDGTQGNGYSWNSSISADGRYVAFDSPASNLVVGDMNTVQDVFIRDTCIGALSSCVPSTIRASVATDDAEGDGISFAASLSATGRYVSFRSDASNLVVGDTNGVPDVFLRDTCLGAPSGCVASTIRVSVASDGTQGNDGVGYAMPLSADGRYVVFGSAATNLVAGDTNGRGDIFLRDTCIGAPSGCVPSTVRVSVASNGTEGNNGSNVPALSADGRFVAFASFASNLVAVDTNATWDAFVRDTCIGMPSDCVPSTFRASVASDGTQQNGSLISVAASISADGRYVVFNSAASNLVAGDTNGVDDMFVRDTCLGAPKDCTPATVRISLASDGRQGNRYSFGRVINADGHYVALYSPSSTLVAGDTNFAEDIFLARTGFPPPHVTLAGLVNAASFNNGGGGVTPGALVSMFGTDLGELVALAGVVPLPTALGDLRIRMAGIDVPLIYASSGQVNLQVPWGFSGPVTLEALSPDGQIHSNTLSVPILSANPGIFTTNQSGSGQGAILIANSSSLAAPLGAFPGSRPVQRGEFIEIFCTGLGPVNNPPPTGTATPDASSTLVFPPTVTIGGVTAPVSFAGLAPGFVALYQVNVQVPQNAPLGDAVLLVLFAGAQANTVTLAVQ